MKFKIIGPIRQETTFATGSGIREIARLRRVYGKGRWRKRKGVAEVEFENGMKRTEPQRYTGMRPQASAARNTKLNILWIKP